jgi:hypothetical protein
MYTAGPATFIVRDNNCFLMGTGLHGENGLDPETLISLLKTYILPILTYGLEIVIPKGKILDDIQNYYKKLLKQLLSLTINVADPDF